VWAWHGVPVTQQIIERPETLKPEQIFHGTNAEVRRVTFQRLGMKRYLRESNARLLHEDEFGKLWQTKLPGDSQPRVMLEVVNSTPEPDDSFKDYFLRVPPNARTAREAVAWTFDVPERKYVLQAQR
jgi:hypothetical protein